MGFDLFGSSKLHETISSMGMSVKSSFGDLAYLKTMAFMSITQKRISNDAEKNKEPSLHSFFKYPCITLIPFYYNTINEHSLSSLKLRFTYKLVESDEELLPVKAELMKICVSFLFNCLGRLLLIVFSIYRYNFFLIITVLNCHLGLRTIINITISNYLACSNLYIFLLFFFFHFLIFFDRYATFSLVKCRHL